MRLDEAPDLLTVEEARSILRCGKNQLYAAVRANEIPSIRIRGAIRIPKRALVEMCGGAENGTAPGSVPEADTEIANAENDRDEHN